jgi:hypothetical protein
VAVLRVDPWDPEYGTSLELDAIEEAPQAVELDIEPVPWHTLAKEGRPLFRRRGGSDRRDPHEHVRDPSRRRLLG